MEIEIFAEYKYTLNELPVKFFLNTSNSLRDIARFSRPCCGGRELSGLL